MAELTRILDEDGYLADVERLDDGGWRITEHNCAILTVATGYRQACSSELTFIRDALPGATVERVAHLMDGAHVCAYEVRPAALSRLPLRSPSPAPGDRQRRHGTRRALPFGPTPPAGDPMSQQPPDGPRPARPPIRARRRRRIRADAAERPAPDDWYRAPGQRPRRLLPARHHPAGPLGLAELPAVPPTGAARAAATPAPPTPAGGSGWPPPSSTGS